jgi:hypothetical protein
MQQALIRKNISILISAFIVFALVFTACTSEGETSDLNVQKITYSVMYGDHIGSEIIVISSDLSMQKYEIKEEIDASVDLKTGELPPEDEYILKEYTITEENWKALVESVNENKFMGLPEDISNSKEVADAGSCYITVTTDKTTYTVGGYDAGGDKDRASQRFAKIEEKLIEVFYTGIEKD